MRLKSASGDRPIVISDLSKDRDWAAVAASASKGHESMTIMPSRSEDTGSSKFVHVGTPSSLRSSARHRDIIAAMPLALRYRGHRCTHESAIKPWYFRGALDLEMGQTFPIPAEGLVLGRGIDADVRVASNGVARKHARVVWSDGELVIEDLDSSNGTEVNGTRHRRCGLRAGDLVTLAGTFDFDVVDVDGG